jgi:hypothetical protein
MPSKQKPKRLNPDALPGDGMAKKAGEAMRKHQQQRDKMMQELFGTKKKDKK